MLGFLIGMKQLDSNWCRYFRRGNYDRFGSSTYCDVGDRIIVGAIQNDGNGANSGHARVFD